MDNSFPIESPSISRRQLLNFSQKGYQIIIDLCTASEGNQLNAEEIKQLGFEYIRVPVDRLNLTPQTLPSFMQAIDTAKKPIYTRCNDATC